MTRKYELILNENKTIITINGPNEGTLLITLDGTTYPVQVIDGNREKGKYRVKVGEHVFTLQIAAQIESKNYTVTINNQDYTASIRQIGKAPVSPRPATTVPVSTPTPSEAATITSSAPKPTTEPGTVVAPLPGRVLDVPVKSGNMVQVGDLIIILEAMKMANKIRAPKAGKIAQVHVEFGETVEKDQPLVTIQ